jgi:hypothetical protein
MTVVRRAIDNDVRSPTYLCEVEEIVAVRPSSMPGWVLLVLVLTLIAVAQIDDLAAVAQWLDMLIGKSMRLLPFTKTILGHD